MTQEEKQILLKDLCARLPYGVIVHSLGTPHEQKLGGYIPDIEHYCIKPYLRSMFSMTEEEKDELYDWGWIYEENNIYSDDSSDAINIYQNYQKDIQDVKWLIDWLNSHHFDYRGLIPMGLALEAPEGMYNK